MAELNALLTAIYTTFSNDATLPGLITDLYDSEAPENTAFPYGTYKLIDSIPVYDSSGILPYEDARIQFTYFVAALDLSTLNKIWDASNALYDESRMSITTYVNLRFFRINQFKFKDTDFRWNLVIEYRAIAEQTT